MSAPSKAKRIQRMSGEDLYHIYRESILNNTNIVLTAWGSLEDYERSAWEWIARMCTRR